MLDLYDLALPAGPRLPPLPLPRQPGGRGPHRRHLPRRRRRRAQGHRARPHRRVAHHRGPQQARRPLAPPGAGGAQAPPGPPGVRRRDRRLGPARRRRGRPRRARRPRRPPPLRPDRCATSTGCRCPRSPRPSAAPCTPPRRCWCEPASAFRRAYEDRRRQPMNDPMEVLRLPVVPIAPRPAFAGELRARLVGWLGGDDDPDAATPATAPAVLQATVTPYLSVRGAAEAIAWYVEVLGAVPMGDPIMDDRRACRAHGAAVRQRHRVTWPTSTRSSTSSRRLSRGGTVGDAPARRRGLRRRVRPGRRRPAPTLRRSPRTSSTAPGWPTSPTRGATGGTLHQPTEEVSQGQMAERLTGTEYEFRALDELDVPEIDLGSRARRTSRTTRTGPPTGSATSATSRSTPPTPMRPPRSSAPSSAGASSRAPSRRAGTSPPSPRPAASTVAGRPATPSTSGSTTCRRRRPGCERSAARCWRSPTTPRAATPLAAIPRASRSSSGSRRPATEPDFPSPWPPNASTIGR